MKYNAATAASAPVITVTKRMDTRAESVSEQQTNGPIETLVFFLNELL